MNGGDNYQPTRFARGRVFAPDKRRPRPHDEKDCRRHIEATRLANGWDWDEFAVNCRAVGISEELLTGFAEREKHRMLENFGARDLQAILADFERHRMILYED